MTDPSPSPAAGETPTEQPDPAATLRTRSYVQLLILAAVIGVPVSAIAYGFLKFIGLLQNWIFLSLPKELGLAGAPVWWPLPLLALSGVVASVSCVRPASEPWRCMHSWRPAWLNNVWKGCGCGSTLTATRSSFCYR
jgi:hypothetical protein